MQKILREGTQKSTRNATTRSLFGATIKIKRTEGVPLLQTRKIFYKGVLGEVAAFMGGPKNVKDFTDKGCNYWKLWSDEDTGDIRLSYGNEWVNWGSSANNPTGINQWDKVVELAKKNIYDRRMIITGWNPEAVENGDLSLPCCHWSYVFNIETINGTNYLNMMYNMRSVDVAVGLPSNMFMAWFMNELMCIHMRQSGVIVERGDITMCLADCHLYEEHWENAKKQSGFLSRLKTLFTKPVDAIFKNDFEEKSIFDIDPKNIDVIDYDPKTKIKYKLYA